MGKNVSKNINKNCSGKYTKKFFDHAKQSATDARKIASKRAIQKNSRSNFFFYNKIAHEITRVSKTSPQNNSEKIFSMLEKYKEKGIYL